MMEAKPTSGMNSQAGSELNTSVGGMSHQTQPLERRVAWLEEDVAVIHRRVKLECGEIVGGSAADSGLRQLVARLDGELAAERRARQLLEARISSLEGAVKKDKVEREVQVKQLSAEIEGNIRGLIGRIDEGLSSGAASMKERTDQAEVRMRTLIRRVDEGLQAGAAALKDTLNTTNEKLEKIVETPGESREPRASEPQRPSQPPRAGASRGSTSPVTVQQQQMLQVRASAGGGGQMLSASRQRSPQGSQAPSHFRSPVATPSMAYPCSLQVPGSGLNGAPPHGVQVRQVPQAHAHPHMAPGGQPMMQGRMPVTWPPPNGATR